ncbi:MAG: NAD(P)-binding protein [Pirellulaceae bacterium]|nr:NAD(P)-binding protein [Pirellulaceae bacterium]
MYDVAVLGGGISGMATAARLQAAGLASVVLESHGQPGGCAGFFRRKGFAFDVGATTLVDFSPGGIGEEFLTAIGLGDLAAEELPGYVAWLPDRRVTLFREKSPWRSERQKMLGESPAHFRLWKTLDYLADVFWNATRRGVKLPVQSPRDVWRIATAISPADWPLARYLRWTVGDLLRSLRLRDDKPLCGLLSMLLEDTVHAGIDDAPLINGSLGITIRGAGLSRARGGMYGFWRRFVSRYRELGGELRVSCPVISVSKEQSYIVRSRRGIFRAQQVVSALPIELTARLAPAEVGEGLGPYVRRDKAAVGGALVLSLGVPEVEVAGQDFTHHQLLQDYDVPLGYGNNMFISVSSPGDTMSAPAGYRAVMISTHCELEEWEGLCESEYAARKQVLTELLLHYSRRVYPRLGERAVVCELATPRTFERFTRRPRGAVGGFRQGLSNTNQRAVPHATGLPGFWLVGDTTWPGLGTVACVHGSRIVAEGILARLPKSIPREQTLQEHEDERNHDAHEPAATCK